MEKSITQRLMQNVAKGLQNFSVIFTTVAAVITFLYFVNSELEKKVLRTMELRKEYAAGVRQNYLSLISKWNVHARESGGVHDRGEAVVREIVNKFFIDPENQRALLDVIDFFDMLHVCIENRACDKNTAITMFGRPGATTYEVFAFYIFSLRDFTHDQEYGLGLERLYRLNREPFWRRYF